MPGLHIITGHYGTGKSEFSVNLALRKRVVQGEDVTLLDLDIVNPYFRSREARAILEAEGIRVVSNSLEMDRGVDLPAISPAAAGSLEDRLRFVIVDLGGDPVGARVMRRFAPSLPHEGVDCLYVVNRFRPENRNADLAAASIAAVSEASNIPVTGLINNTHLLDRTRAEHLLQGNELCRELSHRLHLPVRFVSGHGELLREAKKTAQGELLGEELEIGMHLRQEWMASAPGAE